MIINTGTHTPTTAGYYQRGQQDLNKILLALTQFYSLIKAICSRPCAVDRLHLISTAVRPKEDNKTLKKLMQMSFSISCTLCPKKTTLMLYTI